MALPGPGWAIIHPSGLVHATVAQCSFWHDLRSCRKDRLAVCLLEQKPGGWPQLTVLETVALFPHKPLWEAGFKSHAGTQWAKAARGALLALHLLVLACLFLAGSWIPITAHRDRAFCCLYLHLQMPCRRQRPWGEADLLASQPSCWVGAQAQDVLWELSIIIGHLWSALSWPQTCSWDVRFTADGGAISLSRILISCWAVNAGHFTNCDYFQPVKLISITYFPDFTQWTIKQIDEEIYVSSYRISQVPEAVSGPVVEVKLN